MKWRELIDWFMHTTPLPPTADRDVSSEIRSAQRSLDTISRDLERIAVAVEVAERKQRARTGGLETLPPELAP